MTNTFEKMKIILDEYPEARKLYNRKKCEWYYWQKYDGLKDSMTKADYLRLTPVETIDRAWRKVLEMYYPDSDTYERSKREAKVRNEMLKRTLYGQRYETT